MNRTMFSTFALLSLSACSYTRPGVIAPMSLGPKEHVIAVGTGRSSTDYFFGIAMEGPDTYAAAIEDAKVNAGVKGDVSMANVFADKEVFCFPACFFPIFKSVKTTLYGTLIAYDVPQTQKPKQGLEGAM